MRTSGSRSASSERRGRAFRHQGRGAGLRLARKARIDAADARLMYVSAATMLRAAPGDPGEHSYTKLVDALRQYGSRPAADIEELWRASRSRS